MAQTPFWKPRLHQTLHSPLYPGVYPHSKLQLPRNSPSVVKPILKYILELGAVGQYLLGWFPVHVQLDQTILWVNF